MSLAADRVRAALALGISVTEAELATLQRDVADGPVVELVASDPEAACESDALAPEIRRHFAQSDDRKLAAAAGLHLAAPPALIEATLARTDVQVLVASTPAQVPKHTHGVLVANGHVRERRALARTIADPALLRKLAADTEADVRRDVAANASAPPDVQQRLVTDEAPGVRATLARRCAGIADVLAVLAGDENRIVRIGVASNVHTPTRVLVDLADDESPHVRQTLASNRRAPAEALAMLGGDPDETVRCRVAANPSTAPADLALLSLDPSPDVRLYVARNPSVTDPDVFNNLSGRVQDSAIASNPSAPGDLLRSIAARNPMLDPAATAELAPTHRTVAVALARNSATPPDVLEAIAVWSLDSSAPDDDRSSQALAARHLAGHIATPASTIKRLTDHPDRRARTRAADRI